MSTSYGTWWWTGMGAAIGAIAATLVFAPAVWVQRAAFAATDGRLVLRESSGTVWHGSAQVGLTGGPGSSDAARLPGRVHWDLRPGLGTMHMALQADCCTTQPQQLTFTPGLHGWSLQVLPSQSTWPAALLAGLGTPWNTAQFEGAFLLKTPGLTLTSAVDRIHVEGAMVLEMPALSSRLSTLRPLGSYKLSLQGGDQPQLDLSTMQGSLQLQGTGRWTASHLRFTGEARADADHEAELPKLLNIMGRRDGARSVITLG
jgi:general secretion pathway protein N